MLQVKWRARGFSLIEIALALGIIAVAILAIMALLPAGAESNQNSAEATRAATLLTLLEADLRNTHPLENAGRSRIFGIPLPYAMSGGSLGWNSSLTTNVALTTGVDEADRPVALNSGNLPPFQVSVVFSQIPADPNSMSSSVGRLIVGWPAQTTTDPHALTEGPGLRGFIETTIAFPAP